MHKGIPPTYLALRSAWSFLHLALLAAAAILLAIWWFHDNQGNNLASVWWSWTSNVRTHISNAIPFPWD